MKRISRIFAAILTASILLTALAGFASAEPKSIELCVTANAKVVFRGKVSAENTDGTLFFRLTSADGAMTACKMLPVVDCTAEDNTVAFSDAGSVKIFWLEKGTLKPVAFTKTADQFPETGDNETPIG